MAAAAIKQTNKATKNGQMMVSNTEKEDVEAQTQQRSRTAAGRQRPAGMNVRKSAVRRWQACVATRYAARVDERMSVTSARATESSQSCGRQGPANSGIETQNNMIRSHTCGSRQQTHGDRRGWPKLMPWR
jgi:hypothetical protein